MTELTFEEFCAQPLQYKGGIAGDWGAQRMYRNDDLGVQREVITKRLRHGDIHGGWQDGKVSYFVDGDSREFTTVADLYIAWMEKVCGIAGDKE